jgi:beta-N-acetylhexosaminidase
VKSIEAGIDVYLNANRDVDYDCLVQAVRDGRLSEERIRESTRRVLELKARINLFEDPFGPLPTEAQKADFQRAAQGIADKSITVVRNNGSLPLNLEPGAKILTVTVAQPHPMRPAADLDVFDEELRKRGFEVEHLLNPRTQELKEAAAACQAVFVHVCVTPFTTPGTVRVTMGGFGAWGWRSLFTEHPCVLYTAFGSPYVAYELPHAPNLIAAYGDEGVSQRAAVKVWLGEMEAQGTLPVRLRQVTIQPLPGI